MRNAYRSNLFSPNMKIRITLNSFKRYLMTILLIIIAVIYLAQNISHPARPQVNYWEYYQQGFEQVR